MKAKLRPPAPSLTEPAYPYLAQAPAKDTCPRCRGAGHWYTGNWTRVVCPKCNGTGKVQRQTVVERRYRMQTRIVWQHFKGLHWHSVAACLICADDATRFVVWWRGLTRPSEIARYFR